MSKQKEFDFELPFPIQSSDLEYPKTPSQCITRDTRNEIEKLSGQYINAFTLYRVPTLGGWVLCTLPISRGKRGMPDRTYGITFHKQGLVRVGQGPHVTQEITVHIKATNWPRLKPLLDLYVKGLGLAGATRDRISSRRAQGQQMRAEGRSSWRWVV